MNSGSLLKANTGQTLARFRAILGALVVGMALLLASASVAGATIAADAGRLDSESELSTIELLSVAPSGTPKPLTPAAVLAIRGLSGVDSAIGGGSVGASLSYVRGGGPGAPSAGEQAFSGVFWAMPRFKWSQPPVISSTAGEASDEELSAGEVLLPDSYLGSDLADLVGADLALEYTIRTGENEGTSATMTVHVVGVYDNSSPRRDGDSALYTSERDFQFLLAALRGVPGGEVPADFTYTACWIKAASVADANSLARALTDAGYYVNSGGSDEALPRALGLLKQINSALAVLLALFGVGIGMTVAGTWSTLRRWDVGVLTSLGWSPLQILRVYGAELAIVGAIVGALAALLGTVASAALSFLVAGQTFAGVQFESQVVWPPVPWLLGILLGAPIALVLGASGRIFRLSRIEPDDALRRPD